MQINVSLAADTGKFVTDIERATKSAERAVKKMEAESRKALEESNRSIADLGKKIAGAAIAVATGVAFMVRNLVNEADSLRDFSQQVGISTEVLSQYGAVAEKFGVSSDVFNQALAKINSNLAGAATGNKKAEEGFRLLGLSIESAPGKFKSLEQVVGEIADVISKLPPGSALAQRALEKLAGVGGLAPLFSEGSAAIEKYRKEIDGLGGTISGKFAGQADDFNDSLADLKTALEGIGRTIAEKVVGPLGLYAKVITDAIATNRFLKSENGLALQIEETKRALEGLSPLERFFSNLPIKLKNLQRAYSDIRGPIQVITGALGEQADAGAEAAKQLEAQLIANENAIKQQEEIEAARKKAEAEAEKAFQEARRFQEAQSRGQTEIFEAGQDQQRAILEADLDLRLISYKDYLGERLRLTEAAIDQEIAASQDLIQNATADEAVLLQARIESLEIRRDIAQEEASADEARRVLEIADAYDEAAASARSYLDAISREGQRTLASFDQTPSQRRQSAGQAPIDDRFTSGKESLDRELAGGLDKSDYDKRLTLLRNAHAAELAEYDKYFKLIEAKQKDFTTSFNNVVQEYIDATGNVGETLGNVFIGAIDDAIHATSRLAAEFILFGEGGKDAIYEIARSLATQLLQALIQVGIQLVVNRIFADALAKSLQKSSQASAGQGSSGGQGGAYASLFTSILGAFGGSKASGGYGGDMPRDKIAGVYHGQEFVVNADATRKNRDVLQAINDGTYSSSAVSVPRSGGGSAKPTVNQRIINVPDKSYIKDYLMGDEGDEVFVNWVGRNGSRLKQVVAGA